MAVDFCLEAVEKAIARHGTPGIFNTDQACPERSRRGARFTSLAFTGLLTVNGIAIGMDGKGAWRANVFVEWLWCSVRYEEVQLRAYDSVGQACASLSTTASGRTRALTLARPIAPTSAASGHWRGRHEILAAVVWSSVRSGDALPARRPDNGRMKPAETPLIQRRFLSKQTRPRLSN